MMLFLLLMSTTAVISQSDINRSITLNTTETVPLTISETYISDTNITDEYQGNYIIYDRIIKNGIWAQLNELLWFLENYRNFNIIRQ